MTATLAMPNGANVLHVGAQLGRVYLWAEVNPDAPTVERSFMIIGTGGPVPTDSIYQGTAFVSDPDYTYDLIWHVYEVFPN